MDKLVQLPKFSYTELDFDSIIANVKTSIEEHPEYLENWDDFLETNAGRMMLELNAFISEKVAAKTDWYAREMFISTATKRESIVNILKLINYRPPLPTTARMSVNMKLTKWAPSFSLPNIERIDVPDKNGQMTTFECIENADDGKPNYGYIHTIDTGSDTNKIYNITGIPFYQGRTRTEDDIFMDGVNNERFTLEYSGVIENTVRVKSLTTGKEFVEVDSFISPEAQQNGIEDSMKTVPYRVEVGSSNNVDIVFGHEDLVDIPKRGERLQIKYRTGGGSKTNVVAGALNSTKTYNINGERITVIYSNPNSAAGGSDTENIDEAKLIAPLKLRTANKTVTLEDYNIILGNHPNVLHTAIIGKDNEPDEIYEEFGYFLPSLDTWIYICPIREGLAETNPRNYSKLLQLSKTYTDRGIVDYEDIDLYPSNQSAILKKYRKYAWSTIYVVVYDENFTTDWLAADSFEMDTDFTIDDVKAEFSRVQSVDGGNIPAPDNEADPLTIRVLYSKNSSIEEHKQKTVKTVTQIVDEISSLTKYVVILSVKPNSIYPNKSIEVWDKKMEKLYRKNIDYIVNHERSRIELTGDTSIAIDETLIVYYADDWDENRISEEKMYLDYVKNQKMLCVDNHIKDAVYNTYDVVMTIYTYKNMTNDVKNNINSHIRNQYNLEKQNFGEDISKTGLSAYTMSYPGVRLAEITYLGRDYNLYQNYLLDNITREELDSVSAGNVEFKIEAKYNEILVLNEDEWTGVQVNENKRHGLILTFKEM